MVIDMPQYNSSTDASKRAYTKPHLTFSEQVEQLKSRGMIINDAAFAEHVLATVGYYRMSGYWYPFRKQIEGQSTRSDDFIDGVSFEEVNKLRLFDKRLSSVLFEMMQNSLYRRERRSVRLLPWRFVHRPEISKFTEIQRLDRQAQ